MRCFARTASGSTIRSRMSKSSMTSGSRSRALNSRREPLPDQEHDGRSISSSLAQALLEQRLLFPTRDMTSHVKRCSTRALHRRGQTASITLASGASASNSRYDNASIYIAGGTGAGQTRVIASYVGSTRIATVDLDWTTPPDNTSTYEVSAQAIYATAFTDKPAFLRGFTDEGVFQTTVSCAVPG